MPRKLLIIGCGNMGGAMLAGWLAAGGDSDRFAVLDPALEQAPPGVALYRDTAEVLQAECQHDAVLLGFKPQQLPALAGGLQSITGKGVTVFSLLAGIELSSLAEAFPDADGHVRAMPNLAARLNKSPVILAERGLDEDARAAALQLFGTLGTAMWLEDETQFNLVTALAGSGPGFVYRFIDALAGAAAGLGLERGMADALALSMVEGASALAAQSADAPGVLADRVASPGGMTREGLDVLDADAALDQLMMHTLRKTAEKGDDLARLAGKQR